MSGRRIGYRGSGRFSGNLCNVPISLIARQIIKAADRMIQPDPTLVEYCFLYVQSMCMTRLEWAAWFGAVATVIAIVSTWAVTFWSIDAQNRRQEELLRREYRAAVLNLDNHLTSWVEGAHCADSTVLIANSSVRGVLDFFLIRQEVFDAIEACRAKDKYFDDRQLEAIYDLRANARRHNRIMMIFSAGEEEQSGHTIANKEPVRESLGKMYDSCIEFETAFSLNSKKWPES